MEKKKIEDEDIKWYHELVYRRKCAEIAALESEIGDYNALLGAVKSLKTDLVDCATHLKNTYTYASSGVSCSDFDASIGKIDGYAKGMENLSASIDGVIKSIETEIETRQDKIASIKATMWI